MKNNLSLQDQVNALQVKTKNNELSLQTLQAQIAGLYEMVKALYAEQYPESQASGGGCGRPGGCACGAKARQSNQPAGDRLIKSRTQNSRGQRSVI